MTMNRAQRRAAQKGRTQVHEIVRPLPRYLDEFTIFDIPQTILDRIEKGEIEAANGVPVFWHEAGWHEVCPALRGWIYTWQKISNGMQLNLDLQPLQKLHNKLQASMPISELDIGIAQLCLSWLRAVFRSNDRQRIKQIAQEAQIAILLQDKVA